MRKLLTVLFLLLATVCGAKVRLPALVGNNMVLQRDTDVKIWGWADPGEEVRIKSSWDGRILSAVADAKGEWNVKLQTRETATYPPYTIDVNSKSSSFTLTDVLLGEVWVCSGQSNMGMPVQGTVSQPVHNSASTILEAGAYRDMIRLITVPAKASQTPLDDFKGSWAPASAAVVAKFSATAYHFALNLVHEIGVPVGLIHSSWGGSSIEAWMDEASLKKVAGYDIAKHKETKAKAQHQYLGNLYYGMIAPIKNYTARGFIWYQGEANIGLYSFYAREMQEMVNLWRTDWGNAQMPFYYVQIAPYSYNNSDATSAAFLMEAQEAAMKLIPHSAMATTADAGDELCIHPARKDMVGQRLALLALTKTYGLALPTAEVPRFSSAKFENGEAIVTFDGAGVGFSADNWVIKGFEVAGQDRVFYAADVRLAPRMTEIRVSSPDVPNPVAVRYAFRNYIPANLCNTLGVAVAPFRSDNWDK